MRTLEIGLKGELNGEILTIVSFDKVVFKCDNGKAYMIAKSTWMTNPEKQEEVNAKIASDKEDQKLRAKKASQPVKELTEEQKENLSYLYATGNDMNSISERGTANYRNGKSGMSSLNK